MRVLVTGATSHIGGHVVRALLDRGEAVRALVHRNACPLEGLAVERAEGDVRDLGAMRVACEGCDCVFHLAGVISISGDRGGLVRSVNVEGTRAVAAASREVGVRRLIHFGSIHAHLQAPLDEALDEDRPLVPDVPGHPAYDRSKAEGERAVLAEVERGLDAVILEPTAVIGPGDPEPSRLGRFFLALAHRRLPALVEGGFDWVDVRDVARSAVAAVERARRGERYLLPGRYASVRELGAVASGATGVPAPTFVAPAWLARVGAPFVQAWGAATGTEPLYTTESVLALQGNRRIPGDKAARELGHEARPIEQTVRDLYASFARDGRLPDGLSVSGGAA